MRDLSNIKTIKKLSREYNIRPSKKLGQNFLINKSIVDKIIQVSEIRKDDLILEIGPGFGVLTFEMAKFVKRVLAIEKDKKLFSFLQKEIKKSIFDIIGTTADKCQNKKIMVINEDVLKLLNRYIVKLLFNNKISTQQFNNITIWPFKVISNLPYQITSPVLWKFLYCEKCIPELMVLMVQKEVAERIIAKPGQMNVLAVMCQFYSQPEIVMKVNRKNFWPAPEVDSAIVKLKIKNKKLKMDEKEFFKIVKIGFSNKRKKLKNNLSRGMVISQDKIVDIFKMSGLNENARAQELSIENWIELSNKIRETRNGD